MSVSHFRSCDRRKSENSSIEQLYISGSESRVDISLSLLEE